MILINLEASNRLGVVSRYRPVFVPFGVGSLAGYLLKRGKTVKVIDEQLTLLDRGLAVVREAVSQIQPPHIFGISCMTINVQRGLLIAGWLKQAYPDSKVIFGGIHPTALPEDILLSSSVDFVVRGEGEETLLALYDAIKGGKGYADIPGISFRENGAVRHAPDRALVNDLDSISSFGYSAFDLRKYSNVGLLLTSRGCPYECIFCSQRLVSGRRYRFRSLSGIREEIMFMAGEQGRERILVLDDDFLADGNRVQDICGAIIKSNLAGKIKFSCQSRGDHVDGKLLPLLREAGFTNIAIGMETGSERLMRILDKKATVARNIEAVRLLREHGFSVTAYFLYGIPSETRQDRLQTYLLARRLGLRLAQFSNIVPYPGTKMFDLAQREGRLKIEEDWSNCNPASGTYGVLFQRRKLPYVPAATTEKQLRKDLVRANLYFHLFQLTPLRFIVKKENAFWFESRQGSAYDLRHCVYFIALTSFVFINFIATFDLGWIVGELRQRFHRETGFF